MPIQDPDYEAEASGLNASSSETWNGTNLSKGVRRPANDTKEASAELLFDTNVAEWTEKDFPPLGDYKGERRTETGVWADKRVLKVDSGSNRFVARFPNVIRTLTVK